MWPGSERLREAQSPCPADKAHSLCQAEDLVYRARNVLIPFALEPAGLGGMWSSSLFPFISSPLLQGFVTVSDFAFAILTQTHRIRGANYYLFWDTSPGSPTSWFQLWQQEEHMFGGEKSCSSLCGDVYLCWQGPSRCYSDPSPALTWEMRQLKNSPREKNLQNSSAKMDVWFWGREDGMASRCTREGSGRIYEKFCHWKIDQAL